MKKKNYLTLDDEFIQYCKLNNIEDVEKFAKEIFNKGFTTLKYGDEPNIKKVKVELPSKTIVEIKTPTKEEVNDVFIPEPVVSETVIKKRDIYDE